MAQVRALVAGGAQPLVGLEARAAWSRWTQKLHFSTTPRFRTETSGLSEASIPSGHSGLHQLKERVW